MYEGFYASIEEVIATKTGIAFGNIEVTDDGTWYVPVGLPDGFVFRSESQIAEGLWFIQDGQIRITQERIESASEPAPTVDWEGDYDSLNENWLTMMTVVAARHALAMGYERETVAKILVDLGNAIRTQDAAENMGPLDLEMLG